MPDVSDYFLDIKKSVNQYAWKDSLDPVKQKLAFSLEQKFNITNQLARILTARGITEDEIYHYLDPSLRHYMVDPMQFQDMQKASMRIIKAIQNNEKVAIFGDYDVDGACSSAIMARFLKFFNIEYDIYIPDRIEEGYGPNPNAIKRLIENGATLIITVDCGANSPIALQAAKPANIDVIVLDHHQMENVHDEAHALVNPNRPDDLSGQGHLCAAGVVFMTLVETTRRLKLIQKKVPDILLYLDLVALATICDIVPLIGINRAFVCKGMRIAEKKYNCGLKALIQHANISEPLNYFHFGYILGPRINAGGRIGEQNLGAKLLVCDCPDEADQIAQQLDILNHERQRMETEQLEQAESDLLQLSNEEFPAIIVVANKNWHPGIIGLIASRLKEKFYRPSLAIAIKKDGNAVGSARSIPGVDLGKIIRKAVDLGYLEKGGGHFMAAGFSLKEENIESFKSWLETEVKDEILHLCANRTLHIDGIVSAGGASIELYRALEKAGPYGQNNSAPVLALAYHRLAHVQEVGKNHLSLTLSNREGKSIKAIAFRAVDTALGDFFVKNLGRDIHLVGNLTLNHWRGRTIPQMRVIDAALPSFE